MSSEENENEVKEGQKRSEFIEKFSEKITNQFSIIIKSLSF